MAQVETSESVKFKGGNARFITRLQVYTDPDSNSRLAYNARFFLTPDGTDEQRYIGYLSSWRIRKPTVAHPRARSNWQAELLKNKPNRLHVNVRETAKCLKALFHKDCTVRAEFEKYRNQLQENSLIYIESLFLTAEVRGQRLMKFAMGGYDALLGQLPEWLAFTGTLVLVPGKPIKHQESWEGKSDEQIVADLVVRYEARGYIVWAQEVRVEIAAGVSETICMMGKSLP